MNRKRLTAALLAVLCGTAGTCLLHAAASASAAESNAAIREEKEFVNEDLYALYAQIEKAPDIPYAAAGSEPDFTGMLVTVTGINAAGKEYDIVRNASLETAKEHLQVTVRTEPADPNGLLCDITFSAFSSKLQETLTASVSLSFSDPPETTAPATAAVTTQTAASAATASLTTATVPAGTSAQTTATSSIPVQSATQTTGFPATTTASASSSAVSPSYQLGDCNADNSFTVADAVLLSKWLSTETDRIPAPQAADFDGNKLLNAADLSLMKRALLGLFPDFPVKSPAVIDGFTPCTAQLTDQFSGWRFHVIIKHQYSVPDRVWTVKDFAGVPHIKSVSQYDTKDPYRQVLQLALDIPAKETVLETIRSIEALGLEEVKEVQVVQDFTGDAS